MHKIDLINYIAKHISNEEEEEKVLINYLLDDTIVGIGKNFRM